jgi:hypothetical protein
MALVSLASTPEFDLQIPSTKREATGETATKVGLGWVEGLSSLGGGEGDGVALMACLMWTPVGLALGSAYGSLAGESEEHLRTHVDAVRAVVASLRFEEELKRALLAAAEQQANCRLAPHAPPSQLNPGTSPSIAPSLCSPQVSYVPLAQKGFKTVLEIKSYHPGLLGREGPNPSLAVSVDVRVRLVDAASGHELYYDYLRYRGPKHHFAQWAINGAQPLHNEIRACCQKLADEIVAQAFVRPYAAPSDAVALAESGIRRK